MSNSVCTSLTTKFNHRYASVDKISSVVEDEEKKNNHKLMTKQQAQNTQNKNCSQNSKKKENLKLQHTWLAES
jgi:hypothetical protein